MRTAKMAGSLTGRQRVRRTVRVHGARAVDRLLAILALCAFRNLVEIVRQCDRRMGIDLRPPALACLRASVRVGNPDQVAWLPCRITDRPAA